MRKRTLTLMALALAAVLLVGCSKKENSDSQTDSTSIQTSVNESTESGESELKQKLSDEEMKLISELKIQSFVGPDGEIVQATDAADVFDTEAPHTEIGSPGFKFNSKAISDEMEFDADGNMIDPEMVSTVLRYDFAYIRYRRPLFYKGEMLDEAAEQKMIDELTEDKWFKIKEGDKLDCGLMVKKAVYERFPVETCVPTRDNYIEFDGEITLEGLLYTVKNDRDYLVKTGDLTFIPDPTKTSGIPDCTRELDPNNFISRRTYNGGSTYVLTDGGVDWIIGTVDDIDKDYIFGDDELVRVKVTLKNIKYGGILTVDMPAFYAEIADIERVD